MLLIGLKIVSFVLMIILLKCMYHVEMDDIFHGDDAIMVSVIDTMAFIMWLFTLIK